MFSHFLSHMTMTITASAITDETTASMTKNLHLYHQPLLSSPVSESHGRHARMAENASLHPSG